MTGAGLCLRFDHRLEINVITVRLALEPPVFATQRLKCTSELRYQPAVFFQGSLHQRFGGRAHVDFPENTPIFTVMTPSKVPFVVAPATGLIGGDHLAGWAGSFWS